MGGISQKDPDGEKKSKESKQTRRAVLRAIGVTTGSLIGLNTGTYEISAETIPTTPDAFRVQGKEIVTTRITPNEARVKRRRISTDLKERYGRESLVTIETYPRKDNNNDGLPNRETRTVRRPWNTYYAKEDEWDEYLTGRDKVMAEISPAALDRPADCPKWYYENVDGGFERKGPMNLVGLTINKKIDGLVSILQSWGWTDNVLQYNRFAWIPQRSQFEQQHRSAAESSARLDGGYHVKFWATGDTYTTITAHEDDRVPHEAVSFNTAEFEIVDIFNSHGRSNAIKNRYNFNNSGYLDHGGYVSHIYSSIE
ncbi:hypothetical protein [Halocatena salina]|uniref:Uncharacterized protein n=1 Tax=Halocatena salina TaxID=2934340 RepID=A0A8U0A1V2_9EURY|nr:hypothetical protein [Halocatena salina]UPM42013.1 hypothetical protein MW046_08535 [Halocatena salina]